MPEVRRFGQRTVMISVFRPQHTLNSCLIGLFCQDRRTFTWRKQCTDFCIFPSEFLGHVWKMREASCISTWGLISTTDALTFLSKSFQHNQRSHHLSDSSQHQASWNAAYCLATSISDGYCLCLSFCGRSSGACLVTRFFFLHSVSVTAENSTAWWRLTCKLEARVHVRKQARVLPAPPRIESKTYKIVLN